MKRIRRLARPAVAALALVGFLSCLSSGIKPAATAYASSGSAAAPGRDSAALSSQRIEQGTNQLTTGCNQITETGLPTGGKVGDWINSHVQPSSVVVAVWHYDNPTQRYKAAFFHDPAVPVDQPTFAGAVDSFFVCVSATATAP